MGKATGFLEFEREDNLTQSPETRIAGFQEFHIPLLDEKRRRPSMQSNLILNRYFLHKHCNLSYRCHKSKNLVCIYFYYTVCGRARQ